MESSSTPTTPTYQQVTVEVPEDRIAEFHVFFARFLADARAADAGRHHARAHRPPPWTPTAPSAAGRPSDARANRGTRRDHRGLMADKQVTVAVPEDRVPEFYSWFAVLPGGRAWDPAPAHRGADAAAPAGRATTAEARAWSAEDADQAAWLYGRLAPPRASF